MKEKPRRIAERSVPAGEFKAKCLGLLDEIARKRKPLVVTKRGKAIAKIVPIDKKPRDLFGYMKGTAKITGDIINPIDVEWEAMREVAPGYAHMDLGSPRRRAARTKR